MVFSACGICSDSSRSDMNPVGLTPVGQVPVAFGMILGSCVIWSSYLRVLDTGFQLCFLSLLILGAA